MTVATDSKLLLTISPAAVELSDVDVDTLGLYESEVGPVSIEVG